MSDSNNELRLFAFQPSGHGEPSFFVLASSEDEARKAIDARVAEVYASSEHEPYGYDAWKDNSYGPDYYQLTVVSRGEVIENDND
jgi:hypothetical protein